jgi:GxxExxY protein
MEEVLERARMNFEPQRQVEVYIGNRLIGLLFIDILVENSVIVELKALSHPVTNNEIAQVVTYLKTQEAGVGLLLNFGRKFLEYKRVFPPKKITELTERDLRFGVRLDAKSARQREKRLKTQFIR